MILGMGPFIVFALRLKIKHKIIHFGQILKFYPKNRPIVL